MLLKLSNKISLYFIKKGAIKEEEREVYNYCFEILLSTILNTLIILLFSVISRLYLEGFMFSMAFMIFRGTCGGAHAKTHAGCLITLLIVFGGLIVGIKFIPYKILFHMCIALILVAYIVILWICPVDNVNKPLDKKERRTFKKKSVIYMFLFALLIMILLFVNLYKLAFAICYAIFFVAVSLIVGKIINYCDKKTEAILREKDGESSPKSK